MLKSLAISCGVLLFRFIDISTDVRVECVQSAKKLLIYKPELVNDVTGTSPLQKSLNVVIFQHIFNPHLFQA